MILNLESEILTVEEVARYLRMSKLTVYRLLQEGKIPSFKVGKQWRLKKQDLHTYLEQQKHQPHKGRGSKQ